MSQTNYGDDEWDEFTPSQLFENLAHIENNIASDQSTTTRIDDNKVFPLNISTDPFSFFLDELVTIPIKTQLKSNQTKIPLGDISNIKKILPPPKDSSKKSKDKTPALFRINPFDDDWIEFDSGCWNLMKSKLTLHNEKKENQKEMDEQFNSKNSSELVDSSAESSSTVEDTPLLPPSKKSKLEAIKISEDINDTPTTVATEAPLMTLGGFTTGRGKKLKEVSEEAKKKAEALFRETEQQFIESKPIMSGFKTGSGSALKPISEEAKRKAMDLFKDDVLPTNLTSMSGFATASGNSLKAPSKEAIKNANKLFEEPESSKKRTAEGDLKYEKVINQYGGFQMGNSKKNIDISSQAKRTAISVMNKSPKSEQKPTIKTSTSFTLPKRNGNRVTEVKKQNKQFKSPIIQSKVELTKAAVSNRNVTRNRATPVFDLTPPKNRYTLTSLGKPLQYTRSQLVAKNIPMAVINMTASNAKKYVFNGNWGFKEAKQDMIQSGALPNCTSLAWVENHYGLIVWKIASLIRSYPFKFIEQWTSDTILNQLLYRYEREMNMGHRPILKKVMEQDDLAVKHMILMISDIVEIKQPLHYNTSHKYRLQLTDGWYQVPACIDLRMERAIIKNKLKVGSKLSVCGAKIIGDLEARSPLDITNTSTMLLITTNGCLPSRWDTKLGYHPQKLKIRTIPTIFDDGGMVTALDIVVYRKFPMLYSETLPNGGVITRTAKEEEEARHSALGYNNKYEYDGRQSVSVNFKADQYTTNNKTSLDRSNEFKNAEERRVSGYFKIRICDANSNNKDIATLLLSNANELNHIDIVEGNRYRVFFVMPYRPKNKKYPGLDLKTTRATRWEPKPSNNVKSAYIPRFLTTCKDIRHGDTCSDFDLVVLVLQTGAATMKYINGRKLWHQTLLVTDESQSVCQINFRLPVSPFPDMNGQVIGLVNLRFELYDTKFDITCLKASDETESITKINSSSEYIQKGITKLRKWVQQNPDQIEQVTDRIQDILQ